MSTLARMATKRTKPKVTPDRPTRDEDADRGEVSARRPRPRRRRLLYRGK